MDGLPPIPASPFFLDHLLALLFLVHVLFMNFVLAGPFVAAGYLLLGKERGLKVARLIAAPLPVAFTFAINSGVAVLLFVQVIFGRNFFTANAILGWGWLWLIALLLVGFYGSYIFKSYLAREAPKPGIGAMISAGVGVLVVLIGMTMITNYFIGHSESRWKEFAANPALVHSIRTWLPRFCHFFVGSFAITGFWLLWIGKLREKSDPDYPGAATARIHGLRIATIATGAQVLVGIWYVLSVEASVWARLFSGSFISVVWLSGVISALLMAACLGLAIFHAGRAIWHKIATGLLIWTLFGMIAGRDILRLEALGPEFDLKSMPYETQSGAMLLFWVMLVLGLLTIAWMLKLVWPKGNRE